MPEVPSNTIHAVHSQKVRTLLHCVSIALCCLHVPDMRMPAVSKFDHQGAGLVNTNVENIGISLNLSQNSLLSSIPVKIIIFCKGNNIF